MIPHKANANDYYQGTDTSNAHLQFAQQLILRKLNVTVQNKQKIFLTKQ